MKKKILSKKKKQKSNNSAIASKAHSLLLWYNLQVRSGF